MWILELHASNPRDARCVSKCIDKSARGYNKSTGTNDPFGPHVRSGASREQLTAHAPCPPAECLRVT